MNNYHKTDLIIIGAGPAGMASAKVASKYGISITIIDEQSRAGGQIYRNVGKSNARMKDILGDEYAEGLELSKSLEIENVKCYFGATVIDVDDSPSVIFRYNTKLYRLQSRHLLIATGAIERPMPVPGWNLPGVMTVGAIQILIKSGRIVPKDSVLVGSGPLIYLTAVQLIRSGNPPQALIETQNRSNYLSALVHIVGAIRNWRQISKGLSYINIIREAGVKRYTGSSAITINGTSGVESISFKSNSSQHEIELEEVFIHHGLVPSIQISKLLKLKHRWHSLQRCFSPQVDSYGVSSSDTISIAGDGAGISGAIVANLSGQICAWYILNRLGHINKDVLDDKCDNLINKRSKEESLRPFLDTLYAPLKEFIVPDDETIVCRCEGLKASDIRDCLSMGYIDPDHVKSKNRCGMGLCQGRYCATTVTEIISSELNKHPSKVGCFNIRAPIKPVTLKEIADLNQDSIQA